MGSSRVIRRKIRQRIREVLRLRLDVNRFGARTAALSYADLPAALIYFPSERLLDPLGDSQERELELRVELALQPREDAEEEMFNLADKVEDILLSDPGLESLISSLDLESADFVVDGEGDQVISAAQQTYRVRYLSEDPKPV
jgi:hypothetical protein